MSSTIFDWSRITLVAVCIAPLAQTTHAQVQNEVLKGRAIFEAHCTNCHDDSEHMINDIGPALYGVVGRRIGSVPHYKYSPALTAQDARDECWTAQSLDKFLTQPYRMYEGTNMGVHFDKPADRKALIAYLSTRTSPDLPRDTCRHPLSAAASKRH